MLDSSAVDAPEMCRRCGLEASLHADLNGALAGHDELPEDSSRRRRTFGDRVARGEIPDADLNE
ncbi:MAG: hypothetical protein R2754_09995 [Microthrixaceae bacterium]